jgi:hypothetical protein
MAMFLRRYLDEGIDRMCLDLFFWVETCGICWLAPMTAMFERRFLPEGVAVEETFLLSL